MHIYVLPPTPNIYREAHRETSHKPLQHHFFWLPAARHGLSVCPACPAQREDHARDDQPMLLTAAAPNADVERTRMMKCKPHARTQSTPVVVALPCAPGAHCREAAAVAEPSARPRHSRGENDERAKRAILVRPGKRRPKAHLHLLQTHLHLHLHLHLLQTSPGQTSRNRSPKVELVVRRSRFRLALASLCFGVFLRVESPGLAIDGPSAFQ
jgi:hypothetical protein